MVDHCSGNAGIVVYIPGRSFSANVNPSNGSYKVNWVPPGVYSLCIAKNGEVIETITGVTVVKKTITNIGITAIFRDAEEDGYTENEDCNDLRPDIYPGAEEVCDGVDNNCDTEVDEGCASCTDADQDGFYAQSGCTTAVDCDDSNPAINPIATEVCDGIDNDCDGGVDNLDDLDGDGYTVCDDCDDSIFDVNPGASETCDGLDNDCDNVIDEELPECDLDGDGLSADEEVTYGTDPNNRDSDGDGLSDGAEVNTYGTDPNNQDSDGDSLHSATYWYACGTYCCEGGIFGNCTGKCSSWFPATWAPVYLGDGAEITNGTDPLNPDSDGDGRTDGWEIRDETNDSDHDGVNDDQELLNSTDHLNCLDY